MKEYGNAGSFVDSVPPDERMVGFVVEQLMKDFCETSRKMGWVVPFPGVTKGPVMEAREPCPADLENHDLCALCEGSGQGDIIPGKFVHSFGWYLVVQ